MKFLNNIIMLALFGTVLDLDEIERCIDYEKESFASPVLTGVSAGDSTCRISSMTLPK